MRWFTADFTTREANLIFVWSRMRTVEAESKAARIRHSHMCFTDFLEALVRIAVSKTLPTDQEIEAAGARDAHQFVVNLQAQGEWDDFVLANPAQWDASPRQPIERCVAHVCAMLVGTIQEVVATPGDPKPLSQREVRLFRKKRLEGYA